MPSSSRSSVGDAGATALPIYKCTDRSLGIVYTDVPCKDGERLDVRAGDPDPVAIARLDREREALDRSVAQRIADERRATLDQRRIYNDAGPTFLVQDGGAWRLLRWTRLSVFRRMGIRIGLGRFERRSPPSF